MKANLSPLKYHIYCHADTDGAVAAALLTRHLREKYGNFGWQISTEPVNHGDLTKEWNLYPIEWPCAVLDFTLHPNLLNSRFFQQQQKVLEHLKKPECIPPCYWLDHHPTGASYPFLTEENAPAILPHVITVWDTSSISTPGLMRSHQQKLGFSNSLMNDYQEIVDMAEIIDGALYATVESAHDFDSKVIKLQTLFSCHHPLIDKLSLFKHLVKKISESPNIEETFDSDPIFAELINYERLKFLKVLKAYTKTTELKDNVAVADFSDSSYYEGFGRFIPYLLFPKANFALHISPFKKGVASISCGINPWNKIITNKHLGNYFQEKFSGGGHAYVAGGKLIQDEPSKTKGQIKNLIHYLTEKETN